MSKTKENEPACISCGKALIAHDGLTLTCRKVRKLREAIRGLLSLVVRCDDDASQANRIDDARRALEETS